MVGIIMATVLVVNVTPIQVKVSLNYNSAELRDIAPFIRANTPQKQKVAFYKLSYWNPTQALLFYADRSIGHLSLEPNNLFQRMEEYPETTWLTKS